MMMTCDDDLERLIELKKRRNVIRARAMPRKTQVKFLKTAFICFLRLMVYYFI